MGSRYRQGVAWAKLFASGLVTACLAALVVGVASAHSRPIRFEPSPGQVLTAAPASVTGWFTAELRRDPNWTFLQVKDAQGNRVDDGETQLSNNRKQMTATLNGGLAPGRYQVTWRGFDDADGAIFGDCYYFYVGQAAADQAVAQGVRMDGGGSRDCARIDVEATDGTPVASGTPQVTATSEAGHDGDEAEGSQPEPGTAGDDDGGIPPWTLVLAGLLGIVVGGAGMKFMGNRG